VLGQFNHYRKFHVLSGTITIASSSLGREVADPDWELNIFTLSLTLKTTCFRNALELYQLIDILLTLFEVPVSKGFKYLHEAGVG
jgi:hypothetical protein